MDHKLPGLQTQGGIVYVRPVAVADLPDNLQEQVLGLTTIYSVHKASGERLALVADRALAFALARQHDMAPMSVH
ncbi:DUF1150 domain-containing protein [Rhodobacter sp. KR11]|uniref:DUF1150 domain-containing protein n=1 Tax=Rhodobacter sp. KR11 TaxID=2974588 RepID=UPI002221949E|nr:DUF1150 domain-containing protein [Rhodobacter sp. KR11]MCW1918708.1 DUF1150 domain-containing protein [Rhodobacter sp. KR11]